MNELTKALRKGSIQFLKGLGIIAMMAILLAIVFAPAELATRFSPWFLLLYIPVIWVGFIVFYITDQ